MQKKIMQSKISWLGVGAFVGLSFGLCCIWVRQMIWGFTNYPLSYIDIIFLAVLVIMGCVVAFGLWTTKE